MFAESCSEQLCEELCSNQAWGLPARIAAAVWSLLLIWVGVALLTDVGLGVGLLGGGIILLGEQAVRSHFNLNLEWLWIMLGLLLMGWGFWELYGLKLVLARQPL